MRSVEEIIVNYAHYIQNFEIPELQDSYGNHKSVMDEDGQPKFGSMIEKLNTID